MAIVLKDRVKETSTSTGTGSITLLGATEGYQGFSAIGNGNQTYYAIVNPEDGTWEVGTGTYTSSGTTLSRTTVFESSNAGALVDFGLGTKDVFVTYPAERAIFEEPSGNTLIDGGPLTVVGQGVTGYTSFSAVLAELYGNVDSFAQLYAQNLNDGSSASADLVAYNDLGDGLTNFVDMGINSSNYTSVDYPIFTPSSAYVFNDGGEMFVGSATDDVVIFAGGVDTTDEAVRIDKTTKAMTAVGDVNVGAALDVTGAATFSSTVLLDADPTLALQAATKQYVDNAVSNGFHVHEPVLVATTGNLTATYNNGTAGVGATLTNSGTQVALEIDGVAMTVADRVLVWQQSTPAQNGVYVVSTVGDGSTNWVLTRSSDADTYVPQSDTGLGGGDYFFVSSGATEGFSSFVCTNDGAIVFGTTAITFAIFSTVPSYNVVAPLDLTGNTLSLSGTVAATNGGTGTNTVTTGDLLYGSASNTWSKLPAGVGYKSLVMNAGGTQVEWNAVSLNQSGAVSGALGATNGGTGQSAYAVGDMLYSAATNTLTILSGNTTTTKKFLTQTGTGSVSTDPAWGTISGSDVTGAVTTATNLAGGAANQIAYQTGSGATAFATAPTTANTSLTWNGSALTWASAAGAAISNDTTTNASYYPVWANGTSGVLSTAYVSSTKLSFNPSTGTLSATGLSASGNLTFTGTGNRITGDFSNATLANRVMFQTSTVNGVTGVGLLPNGTSNISAYTAYSTADPANSSVASMTQFAAETRFANGATGAGSYAPMTFYTGGTERVRITTAGNVGMGGITAPGFSLEVGGNGTLARFTGSGGAFQGFGVRNNYASGSNYGGIFYDALNENAASVANMFCDINTDGSSAWSWSTQVAGTRTDRRAERLRINSSGNLVATGTITSTAFSGPLTGNVTGNLTGSVTGGTVNATTGSFSGQLSVAQSTSLINNGINLNAAGSGFLRGTNNDAASSTQANIQLMSWWGIGFSPSIGGQAVPYGENAIWMDVRNGTLAARGTISAPTFSGNATTATALTTAVGSAPSYACRAWASFPSNGALRGAGNVTSVTVLSTAVYRVNFTTAMADANYAVTNGLGDAGNAGYTPIGNVYNLNTTDFTMRAVNGAGSIVNYNFNTIAVFR